MTNGSIAKEFSRLLKNIDSVTDGQAEVCEWNDEDLETFKVQIKPNAGYYRGGKFVFEVRVDAESYFDSDCPPTVICQTEIYHPNIDTTSGIGDDTNVCVNILDSGTWLSSFGLEACVHGLVFLFHNPNLEDPLSPLFNSCMDEDDFTENVKLYMAGEPVDDVTFDKDFSVKPSDFPPEISSGDVIAEGEVIHEKGEVTHDTEVTRNTNETGEVTNDNEVTRTVNDTHETGEITNATEATRTINDTLETGEITNATEATRNTNDTHETGEVISEGEVTNATEVTRNTYDTLETGEVTHDTEVTRNINDAHATGEVTDDTEATRNTNDTHATGELISEGEVTHDQVRIEESEIINLTEIHVSPAEAAGGHVESLQKMCNTLLKKGFVNNPLEEEFAQDYFKDILPVYIFGF